jgi:hypothetical protein
MATETTETAGDLFRLPLVSDALAVIYDDDGEEVGGICGDDVREQQQAAMVCRAVNAHDALVTACDAALCAIRLERQLNPGFSAAWEHIERPLVAALAAAKGGR